MRSNAGAAVDADQFCATFPAAADADGRGQSVFESCSSQPWATPYLTISARVARPALSTALALWVSTVLTLMFSSRAISLLLNPCAMNLRTSHSRAVSSLLGWALGGA